MKIKVSSDVPLEFIEDHLPDPDKVVRRVEFVRGGGSQKTHGGQHSHGHKGSGCNHESIPGVDKMTPSQHKLLIERQAARTGVDIEAAED